ncbi:hypothetical protein NMF85_10685 [Clostridioides difficile]|uniref:hypothetical protein n=1 Tax=Clostridioides difficile TaxID=1496 RepID=UPI001430C057|nr:hypothetical protein [Clostridioides difficile]MCK3747756.1 hypothetical protein [Clostridioides difficile]MCP8397043.1 hypothetical protein [Clostridioides difficile]MCP8415773.1 hypothetical protein [Clostridioides difficile]MCP8493757.1 hypothetical protein [Clostridioides difficile]MCP8656859.1 hypothetical protein [Clostridioides difficile]
MQKKVINHFIDCIKKSRQRMLIEKGDKYYLSDGICIFIIDKKEMVLNPKMFLFNSEKVKKIVGDIKETGYQEVILKYYIPVHGITYHKYICTDFEIYLNEAFIKVFDKFDKVEAIDSKSPARISMKGHVLGYLMPATIKEN